MSWWDRNCLTGSRMTLAGKCCAWAQPSTLKPPARADSKFESNGTALHFLTEHTVEHKDVLDPLAVKSMLGLRDMAESDIEQVASWYAGARDFLATLPASAQTETAFAYDVASDTARMLPKGGRRDYSQCADTEIPTTLDVWWVQQEEDGSRTACVGDWETGWSRYKGRAKDSMTMALGALAVARTFGCDRARVMIWRVSDSGVRVDAADIVSDDDAELSDVPSLSGRAFEIACLHDDVKAPAASPVVGLHCKDQFCPALSTCPEAQRATHETELVELSGKGKPLDVKPFDTGRIMSADFRDAAHARDVLLRLGMVEAACKKIRAGLEKYTETNGKLEIEPGKVWGKQDRVTEKIKPTKKSADLLTGFLDDDELAPLPRAFSKTKLKKKLGAAKFREAMAVLRDHDCTTSKDGGVFTVHKGATPELSGVSDD